MKNRFYDLNSQRINYTIDIYESYSDLSTRKRPPFGRQTRFRSRTGPFFLVGSWDDWTGFTELWHCGAGVFRGAVHMETQTSQTQREASVQFQVLRGRDWAQRFHPDEAGDGLAGPDGQHGLNWHAKLKERWLEVTWCPARKPLGFI